MIYLSLVKRWFSFGEQIKIVDDLQPVGAGKQELPYMKMEDTQYFAKLLEDVDEETLSADEQKERKIMRLLLKIKNGTPPMRKVRERNIIQHPVQNSSDHSSCNVIYRQ